LGDQLSCVNIGSARSRTPMSSCVWQLASHRPVSQPPFSATPYWQIDVDEPRSPQPQVPFRRTTWRLSCRTCTRKRPRTKSSARPQFTVQNADNAVPATPSMRRRPGGVLCKSGVAARQTHNV